MNPYPFVGLNHFTVPEAIIRPPVGARTIRVATENDKTATSPPNAAGIPVHVGSYCRPMGNFLDQTDFSVVVKNRAAPPKPWRWEIYRAGRKSPIECSSVLYETVEAAGRAGKEALKQLLTEFPD